MTTQPISMTCPRCGGEGGWKGWPDWTCFQCGGSGKVAYRAARVPKTGRAVGRAGYGGDPAPAGTHCDACGRPFSTGEPTSYFGQIDFRHCSRDDHGCAIVDERQDRVFAAWRAEGSPRSIAPEVALRIRRAAGIQTFEEVTA